MSDSLLARQTHRNDSPPHTITFNSITLPNIVTELPTNPRNGDTVRYLVDATNDVYWWLYYDANSTSSLYKWRPYGMVVPLTDDIVTAQGQTAVNTWGDLSTTGPTVTVPFAGDYIGRAQGTVKNTYAGANRGFLGIAQGAGTPAWVSGADIAAQDHYETLPSEAPFTGLSAGTELRVRYQQVNNGMTWSSRFLSVTPIRVG